jgi:hypothetical protein
MRSKGSQARYAAIPLSRAIAFLIRAKDHNANRGQFWGKMVMDPKYPFAVMQDAVYVDPAPLMD